MHYIKRAMEARLEKYSRFYKAVLVTGARQVGKSTLLKKVFPERRYVSLHIWSVMCGSLRRCRI